MVDGVDEEGEAEDVGEEDEFLGSGMVVSWGGVGNSAVMGTARTKELERIHHTCRTSLHILPTRVRNSIAAIHSFVLSLVSLAKSCRCVTSLSVRYFNLGSGHCEFMV